MKMEEAKGELSKVSQYLLFLRGNRYVDLDKGTYWMRYGKFWQIFYLNGAVRISWITTMKCTILNTRRWVDKSQTAIAKIKKN